jgi:hypothetical protein
VAFRPGRLGLPPSQITGPVGAYLREIHDAVVPIQRTSGFTTVASSFTINELYYKVRVKSANATSALTVYLPPAQRYTDWVFNIKLTADSVGSVVLQTSPSVNDVIEGSAIQSIKTAGTSIYLQSYGTGWDFQ